MLGRAFITLAGSRALSAFSQFPLFRFAMASKSKAKSPLSGKRLEAHQQKEDIKIVESFSSVIDAASEREIAYVSAELRKNVPLLYSLSGLLKSDSLTSLLDGRMKAQLDEKKEQDSASSQKPVHRVIPLKTTKFKHLGADATVEQLALAVLARLEPVLFTEETGKTLIEQSAVVGALCMALRVCPETFLPSKHFEDVRSYPRFHLACEERYKSLGRPLHACTLETVMAGFYLVQEKTILCAIDGKAEKTLLRFPHADAIEIIDKYNIETGALVTNEGLDTELKNLSEAFAAKDLITFDPNAQWDLPPAQFGVKPAETKKRKSESTPTKDRMSRSSGTLSPDANLSDRLRSRLPPNRHKLLRRRGSSCSGHASGRG